MTMPKAYEPQQGYMYQILGRGNNGAWESLDYAKFEAEKNYLLHEYKMAYRGQGWEFKVIKLPKKYHCLPKYKK